MIHEWVVWLNGIILANPYYVLMGIVVTIVAFCGFVWAVVSIALSVWKKVKGIGGSGQSAAGVKAASSAVVRLKAARLLYPEYRKEIGGKIARVTGVFQYKESDTTVVLKSKALDDKVLCKFDSGWALFISNLDYSQCVSVEGEVGFGPDDTFFQSRSKLVLSNGRFVDPPKLAAYYEVGPPRLRGLFDVLLSPQFLFVLLLIGFIIWLADGGYEQLNDDFNPPKAAPLKPRPKTPRR